MYRLNRNHYTIYTSMVSIPQSGVLLLLLLHPITRVPSTLLYLQIIVIFLNTTVGHLNQFSIVFPTRAPDIAAPA